MSRNRNNFATISFISWITILSIISVFLLGLYVVCLQDFSLKSPQFNITLGLLANKQVDYHEFKSAYITTLKNYSSVPVTLNTSMKMKTITCFNCPDWFINEELNTHNRGFQACPYRNCVFESRQGNTKADVLLIFTGYLPSKLSVPARTPGQIWVHSFWEAPDNFIYPNPYDPWKSLFNWTFTYRTDSDLFAPNNRLAWRNREELLPSNQYLEIAKKKTKLAAWFVSHCETTGKREFYIKEMMDFIDIDIYGECGTHKCLLSNTSFCEEQLTTTYKFYIGFENSICKDYVTEKLFRSFQYRTHVIPVVRGGFDYEKYILSGVYVNAAKFSRPKDLALYLLDLGNDVRKYAKMLEEKDKLTTLNYKIDWCDVCEKIHTDTETRIIPDIKQWTHGGNCKKPRDFGF